MTDPAIPEPRRPLSNVPSTRFETRRDCRASMSGKIDPVQQGRPRESFITAHLAGNASDRHGADPVEHPGSADRGDQSAAPLRLANLIIWTAVNARRDCAASAPGPAARIVEIEACEAWAKRLKDGYQL